MPTELEELVEFLHHGNTQIRQIAAENLVSYSATNPQLFKRNQLEPVRDLKLLIRDYAPIAANALTILINLSGEDVEVRESLASDETVMKDLVARVTDAKEPNADLACMLLANLSKSPALSSKLLLLQREVPSKLSTSPYAIDQLFDVFVKGATGSYNEKANYDYLSYLFADLAQSPEGRAYLLYPRKEDKGIVPLTKLIVFTEHESTIRRRGVANAIKNCCFEISAHPRLLASEDSVLSLEAGPESDTEVRTETRAGIDLLPYLLLPLLSGNDTEALTDEESDLLPDSCQLLPPSKLREVEADILCTHLETLLLLTTTQEGRRGLRANGVYPVVRELHVGCVDEGVREGCDRLVQVLMRDEEVNGPVAGEHPRVQEIVEEEDEEERIVDVL